MNAPFLLPADNDALRHKVERAVERLLAFLDTLDAVAEELEDDELEPSFDAPQFGKDEQEPWLSAPENHPGDFRSNGDQSRWAVEGGGSPLSHAEQDEGDEPSLGWTSGINQAGPKWHGTALVRSESEHPVLDGEQGDDNGIGDALGIQFDYEEQHDREQPDHW